MENITISNGKFIHFTDTVTNIKNFYKHWKNVLKNLLSFALSPSLPLQLGTDCFQKSALQIILK